MKGRTIDSKLRNEIIDDWLLRNGDISSRDYELKYNISKESICLILDDAVEIMKKRCRLLSKGKDLDLIDLKKKYKEAELNPMQLRKKAMMRFVEMKKNSTASISLIRWSEMLNTPIHILKQAIEEYG